MTQKRSLSIPSEIAVEVWRRAIVETNGNLADASRLLGKKSIRAARAFIAIHPELKEDLDRIRGSRKITLDSYFESRPINGNDISFEIVRLI